MMLPDAVAFGSALKLSVFLFTEIRPPPGVGVAVGVAVGFEVVVAVAVGVDVGVAFGVVVGVGVAVLVGVAVAVGLGVPVAVADGVATAFWKTRTRLLPLSARYRDWLESNASPYEKVSGRI